MPSVRLEAIRRTFAGQPEVVALDGIDLTLRAGELVAIVGPSGSGKSSLLQILGLLDSPTAGDVWIGSRPTALLSDVERTRVRAQTFGFVFQSFHLIERQTATENAMLGLLYRRSTARDARNAAIDALRQVGLGHRLDHEVRNLSGGERQRVAIARALVGGTPVIVADEPTGSLDSTTSEAVVALLRDLQRRGKTVVIVTHDAAVAASADRSITIEDGHLVGDTDVHHDPEAAPRAVGIGDHDAGRTRISAALADSLRSVRSRPAKSIALAAAVAVAIALGIGTQTLAATANAQVSNRFDRQRSREVAGESHPTDSDRLPQRIRSGEVARNLAAIPGIVHAGIIAEHDPVAVSAAPDATAVQASVIGTDPEALAASHTVVRLPTGQRPSRGAPIRLADDQVLVGASLADDLQIGPLEASPTITIAGRRYWVRGIIRSTQQVPAMLTSLILDHRAAASLSPVIRYQVEIQTTPGAAQVVARQLPSAIDPTDTHRFAIKAPPDPRTLRDALESDVGATLVVLSAIAAVAAVIAIANTVLLGVMERTGEFGLRRAIGARQIHIAVSVVVETAIVGVVGAALGIGLGLAGVLAVSLSRGWVPVLVAWTLPAGLIGGLLVGVVGGTVPALKAARMDPAQALRQ